MLRNPLYFAAVLLLASVISVPGRCATTSITLAFSGSSSSANATSGGFDFSVTGTGAVSPFGSGAITASGSATFTPAGSGTVNGTFAVTFGNGDSFQGVVSGSISLGANQSNVSATATITGGTGSFNNATGSLNTTFAGVSTSQFSSDFTLSGSGNIDTPKATPSNVTVDPSALQFATNEAAKTTAQTVVVKNSTADAVTFSATASVPWLTVSPATGNAAAFGVASISATASALGMKPGVYLGDISISVAAGGESVSVHVTLTVTGSQQGIGLSQTGLRFPAVQGGGAPASQTIAVLNEGGGTLNFSATASTISGGNWLSVSPASGSSSSSSTGSVAISINPAGLGVGNYYGKVEFTAQGVQNSPQIASIVLNIFAPTASPGPSLSKTGLILVAQAGGQDPAAQEIVITNPSPNPLTFAAAPFLHSIAEFFTAQSSGTVTAGSPVPISVQTTITGLPSGVYTGELAVKFTDTATQVLYERHIAIVLIVIPAAGSTTGGLATTPLASGCTPTKLIPVFTQLGDGFQVSGGWPTPLEVTVVDDCGAYLTAGNVAATFSSGDPALALAPLNDGRWSGTWNPTASSTQVTITAQAQQTQPALYGTANISGGLQPNPSVPVVAAGGVVSAASNAAHQPIGPGSYISIYGSDLSQGVHQSTSLPLANQLGGTQAILAGKVLPLNFTSSGQINAIVPFDVPVNTNQQLVVQMNGALSVPEPVVLSTAQPAIFTQDQSGKGLGVIVGYKADGSAAFLIDANHAVSSNDVLVIYCTGLGPVDQPVAAGSGGPSSPLAKAVNPVTLTVGGKNAKVLYAGLAPGLAVYQVNAVVPSGVAPGNSVPVVITTAGLESVPVTIAVK